MREWRELSAGRLLAIRREILRETEDALILTKYYTEEAQA